ncbi:hypothetical protein WMZ97_06250 [Lentibacillus sp. N15]|uniref:hypothetical protein n=1 Tax=Lentibacillus songyuanensis TaxID=3136161 RepID=UPI0031BB870E
MQGASPGGVWASTGMQEVSTGEHGYQPKCRKYRPGSTDIARNAGSIDRGAQTSTKMGKISTEENEH